MSKCGKENFAIGMGKKAISYLNSANKKRRLKKAQDCLYNLMGVDRSRLGDNKFIRPKVEHYGDIVMFLERSFINRYLLGCDKVKCEECPIRKECKSFVPRSMSDIAYFDKANNILSILRD
jgi:hypothetical protein